MSDVSATVLSTAVLRKFRAIDPSETPNDTELANVFAEIKRMLKLWAAKGLRVPASTLDQHTLTAGTTNYSIGSGGDIDTDRPLQINEGSFVQVNGVDYRLKIIGETRYNSLSQKSVTADTPELIYYKPSYPLGYIYLWPPGGGTLNLYSWKYIDDPAAIGNDYVVPEEYQDAIVWNAACRMSPEFIGDPTPYMIAMASGTLRALECLNAANDPPEADADVQFFNNRHTFDINRG